MLAGKKLLILIGLVFLVAVLLSRLLVHDSGQKGEKIPVGNSFTTVGDFHGSGQNKLLRPLAAVMDQQAEIYVADSSHHRVLVFDLQGKVVAEFGKPGKGKGEFDYPTSLAVKDNLLFVGDSSNFRIQVLSKQGEFLYSIPRAEDKLGKVKPVGLTLDGKGKLYVADGAGQRILVFDENGKFLRKFGKRGTGEGEFGFPNGIVLDEQEQSLYVADFANGRIQVFTPEGKFKQIINGEQAGFTNPRGLAYDPQNKRLYVADIFEHRIVVLSSKGEFLGTFGTIGSGLRQFHFPNGLWFGKGILLVADRENHRVVMIRRGGENK